jgi:hypothetical protein
MSPTSQPMNFTTLKSRHRELRDGFPQPLALRTHRALSWLHRAEQETDDHDCRFIFLWIAFNAAYANEITSRRDFSERRLLLMFLNRLIESDKDRLLYDMIWKRYSASVRLLIDNQYVYQPFWNHVNGELSEAEWRERFAHSKRSANNALARGDTRRIFAVAFDRLYVLRNQVVHGGATWNSSVNRSQIKDGASILGDIVPIVIHLMMENPGQLWGDPCYPVVA